MQLVYGVLRTLHLYEMIRMQLILRMQVLYRFFFTYSVDFLPSFQHG